MKKRYNFSKSVRNPYLRKPKKQLAIRLDEDTIDYFRALAEKKGIPYQNLINLYLRDCAESKAEHEMGVTFKRELPGSHSPMVLSKSGCNR